MRLRAFKTEDTESVLQLVNTYASFEGAVSKADLVITEFFNRGFWVAEENRRVVGFAYGYFKDVPDEVLSRWGASKVGYIALMAVDQDYRNKGVRTALLHKLLEEFKKAGADLATLYCPAEAAEAKKPTNSNSRIRSYDMKKGFNRRYGMPVNH